MARQRREPACTPEKFLEALESRPGDTLKAIHRDLGTSYNDVIWWKKQDGFRVRYEVLRPKGGQVAVLAGARPRTRLEEVPGNEDVFDVFFERLRRVQSISTVVDSMEADGYKISCSAIYSKLNKDNPRYDEEFSIKAQEALAKRVFEAEHWYYKGALTPTDKHEFGNPISQAWILKNQHPMWKENAAGQQQAASVNIVLMQQTIAKETGDLFSGKTVVLDGGQKQIEG